MARRQSGITWWALVFCAIFVHFQLSDGRPGEPRYIPTAQDLQVERMARVAVGKSLRLIGHGVEVGDVRVRPLETWVAAWYITNSDEIEFNAGIPFTADEVLNTAAHETVHALFDQAGLNPYSESPAWDTRLLVEETTAKVLSAHIVGQIRSRCGGDGEELTRRFVDQHRKRCSWAPQGYRRFVWLASIHDWPVRIEPDVAYVIETHYGSVKRVDEIDQICRDNPDPWVAAHVIAERFIEPIDEPAVPGRAIPQ